jgi:hypothetical protein
MNDLNKLPNKPSKKIKPVKQPSKPKPVNLDRLTKDSRVNQIIRLWINGVPNKVICQKLNMTLKKVQAIIKYERSLLPQDHTVILADDIRTKVMRLFYNHNQLSADITSEYMSIVDDTTTIAQLPDSQKHAIMADMLKSKVNLSAVRAKLRSELRDNDKMFFEIVSKMGGVGAIPCNEKESHTDTPTSKPELELVTFNVGDKSKFLKELEKSHRRTAEFLKKHRKE